MVQSLKKLIEEASFKEETFREVSSLFTCKKNNELSHFLQCNAVAFEKQNLARTYLILDDYQLGEGKIKINAFFLYL